MVVKLFSFVICIAISSLVNSIKFKNSLMISEPKIKVPKSTFFLTVDNDFQSLHINENPITLCFNESESSDWTRTKKLEIYLFTGDIITIKGKNKGYISGILGSIHFLNKHGKEKIYNTGKGWLCNDKAAKLVGKNDGTNVGFAKEWKQIPEIEKEARWIWDIKSAVHGTETVCTFQIPCEEEEEETS